MIDALLDRMTLEEQVALLAGADFWTTVPIDRLGIPRIKVTDGPNGARGGGSLVGGVKSACFPAAIALGAGFDPKLARAMGVALAEEAKTKGARVLLAPTVNLHRSGLNGRNFECYSEDPVLTTELAVAYIEGVQGEGIAATIKHFVANESEIDRQTMSSDVDERALRELYLAPFEAAVKRARVMAVMSSYNRLNGTWTSEHPWLLTQVLRGDWGFDGIVMSDWFGSHTTVESVTAGLDLEMPGPTRDRGAALVQAVEDGRVPATTVRSAAGRILRLLERVGAFADPSMAEETAVDRPEHRALIRRLGAEGAVLLKNDGILPLAKAALDRIAVLGPNAAEAKVMGGGSAQINAHYKISPLEGIRAALGGGNSVVHAVGCRNNRLTALLQVPIAVDFFRGTAHAGPVVHHQDGQGGEFVWLDMPSEALDPADFSARLTGSYRAVETGDHVFGLANAGRARLYVDGDLVVDADSAWTRGDTYFGLGNTEARGIRPLEAGRSYAITVDYRAPAPGVEGINLRAIRIGVEHPLGEAAIDEAVARAREADVAIIFAGREGEWDSEGVDLPGLALPGRQDALIAAVAAANPRTIVVLQTGGPIAMPWLADVAAVLQLWYPGQELGNAVADLLFGDAEPGGRLPQTFPHRLADLSPFTDDPATYPGKDGHVVYREGVFIGYRHTDRTGSPPLFPFGFGLSYTRFAWSAPRLSARTIGADGVTVEVDITNTGNRSGSEVVQLYVRPRHPTVDRPIKELRAFAKLRLAPGETGTATLAIALRDLCWFDVDARAFRAVAGDYDLVAAASATDIRGAVTLTLLNDWSEPVRPG